MKSMNKVQTFGLKVLVRRVMSTLEGKLGPRVGGIGREECCLISKLLQVIIVLTYLPLNIFLYFP
jgi:hypothetical protein